MRKNVLIFGSLATLAISSVANAGFVATDIPTSTSDFGYLSPTLNPLLAVDLNGSGETINGVTFTGGGLTGGSGGLSYSVSSTPDPENGFSGFSAGASGAADSAQINQLLANFFYPGSHPSGNPPFIPAARKPLSSVA